MINHLLIYFQLCITIIILLKEKKIFTKEIRESRNSINKGAGSNCRSNWSKSESKNYKLQSGMKITCTVIL